MAAVTVRLDVFPEMIVVGFAIILTVGAGFGTTVTTAIAVAVPPAPVAVAVYVVVAVGVTESIPPLAAGRV